MMILCIVCLFIVNARLLTSSDLHSGSVVSSHFIVKELKFGLLCKVSKVE